MERLNRFNDSFLLNLGDLLLCRFSAAILRLCLCRQHIFIKSIQQILCQIGRRNTNGLREGLLLRRRHLTIQTDDAAGKGCQGVFVLCAQCYIHHQFFHADGRLPLQSTGIGLLGLGNAHSIHDDKVVFILCCRGSDLLQIVLAESPGASAFHLLKIVLAAYIAHENQALDRFHIGTSCNHIYSNSNSWIVVIPEGTQDGFRIFRSISNLFAELVALTKFLADDLNNIICVAVGFGKDQSLGYFLTPGEKGCIESILKRTDNGADLTGVHNVPVKLRGTIVHIFIQLRPSFFPGKAVAVFHHLLENGAALLAYFRFDQEDILAHIDTVDDSLLSGVFADDILIEERKSTLVRCCGQANLESVKVLQHLFPHIVDGTVALVDDNYIKEFGRILGVINNFLGGLLVDGGIFKEGFTLGRLVQFLAPENRVHALDGADAHLHVGRNKGGL